MTFGPGELPVLTIVMEIAAMVLTLGVPLGVLIVFRKKTKASFIGVGIGALIFIVFVSVEKLIQSAVFNTANVSGQFFANNIFLMGVVGALFAAVFEETGRYVGFTFLKRKHPQKEQAVMYGIGHGGIEAILLGFLTMFSNLMIMVALYNTGMEKVIVTSDSAAAAQLMTSLSVFYSTPSVMFLLSGIERVFAFVAHMAMSVVVYKSVAEKKIIYFIAGLGMHFLLDMMPALYSAGIISNIYVIEALIGVEAVIFVIIAKKIYVHMNNKQAIAKE